MIFSSLFKKKPSWQHQDSTLRITAINDELNRDNSEHYAVLVSLINDDKSDLVRRAALIKLHDFDVFVTAAKNNSSEKVRSFAAKKIEDILVGMHPLMLSTQQKQKFLFDEQANLSLVEHCLSHETDSDMIIRLFELINKRKNAHTAGKKNNNNQFLINTFTQKQDEKVQRHLLLNVDETKLLEKLLKKACNESVTALINLQLNELNQLEQKPALLNKQAQLVLSKLLALNDNLDYGVFEQKKLILANEWQVIQSEFNYLTEEQQQLFNSKYENINSQLDKAYAYKVEAFEQQKIIDKLNVDKRQAKVEFSKKINAQNQRLTTAVFENESLDEQAFGLLLNALSSDVSNSVLNKQEQLVFIEQIKQLSLKLGQLGDIAESVSQATALISSVSQLTLPESLAQLNERAQVYNQWLQDWRAIEKKTNGMLPASIKTAQQEISTLWQQGLKPLQAEQKNVFFQQKKKLNDIKRLIEQGKYKVCFGIFSGVKDKFLLLSFAQQQQLQRDYDHVNEKLAELTDWEHYIATPRKKELLSEIQQLITKPLDNPNEQASKVKQYRQTWNSLGHAEDEVDKELNEQFNQACEEAFAPCRLFYAEQDRLRLLHLATRENIISKAKALLATLAEAQEASSVDFKNLDGQLNKLQSQWQNAGEVDRQHYKRLQTQFREILQPVKTAISNFHQANVIEKKALIVKAQSLKDSDNVFQAIEEIKKLQQVWKNIGFAGGHQEAKLWNAFRTINDEVFAQRQQAKEIQQEEQSKQEVEFTERLTVLKQAFIPYENDITESSDDAHSKVTSDNIVEQIKQLKIIKESAQVLLTDVSAHKPIIKVVSIQVERFASEIESTLVRLSRDEKKQLWLSLFSLLTQVANEEVSTEQLLQTPQYSALSKSWKKRIEEYLLLTNHAEHGERAEQTIVLEILAQVTSPAEFAEQRMRIQVQMLQSKMLSGSADSASKHELRDGLVTWLMLGKLNQDDLALLARVKAIYCS